MYVTSHRIHGAGSLFSIGIDVQTMCAYIGLEQYCFNPKDVLKVVTREEYLYFLTYALEYRAMVMEQLSHEMEEDYLRRFPREDDRVDGYGVILLDYTIRDLKGSISPSRSLCVPFFPFINNHRVCDALSGVGFNHLGSDGRAILKAALDIGLRTLPLSLSLSPIPPYLCHATCSELPRILGQVPHDQRTDALQYDVVFPQTNPRRTVRLSVFLLRIPRHPTTDAAHASRHIGHKPSSSSLATTT